MSKRSNRVKTLWKLYNVKRNLGTPAPSLRTWARMMAQHSSLVAAWLKGKCKACYTQATSV